jgi:predicted acylesterase/phospholipase RssA
MNIDGQRIGLALSGGGFRASIFHLGVIRRLEELKIMKDVSVLSTVSGGSIIGAYYACEMEQRLRNLDDQEQRDPNSRVRLWAEIAGDFLAGTDQNLRTRALLFTPFYHPFLFLKTLVLRTFRAGARAELIQEEYDRWFYKDNTLDQLPAVTPDRVGAKSNVLFGPKLVINTTSLLTGERVPFSREPVSGLSELSKVDKNVLPLSRVVGASAGVPVLFPPTGIAGNLLVDGGLSDNQGIEGLLAEACNVVLISDASGQLEQLDTLNTSEIGVYSRTNDILQHQVRDKLIQLVLAKWESAPVVAGDPDTRESKPMAQRAVRTPMRFALVHLFRNLKDRDDVTERVSSEFIPAIARIRTDLDQFSHIEREALMYHGYTLIDAQLRSHCKGFLAERFGPYEGAEAYPANQLPELRRAPLFRDSVQRSERARNAIRNDLRAGHQKLYLLRAMEKHPGRKFGSLRVGGATHWTLGLFTATALAALAGTLSQTEWPLIKCKELIDEVISGVIPMVVQKNIDRVLVSLTMPKLTETISGISGVAAVLILLALYLYVAAFPAYVIVRRITSQLDRRLYSEITGEEPGIEWDAPRGPATNVPEMRQAARAGAEGSTGN